MGGEIDDAELVELCLLDAGLGGVGADKQIGLIRVYALGNLLQFLGGLGQWVQFLFQFREIGHRAAAKAAHNRYGAGQFGVFRELHRTLFEHRIGETDERLGRFRHGGLAAQHLQARDRRQHGDGVRTQQPVHILERLAGRDRG